MRRALAVPTLLAVTALAGCTDPVVNDASTDIVATDTASSDASCTQCVPVTESDGAVRYQVCTSNTAGCACVIYTDGAVQDPTFC